MFMCSTFQHLCMGQNVNVKQDTIVTHHLLRRDKILKSLASSTFGA